MEFLYIKFDSTVIVSVTIRTVSQDSQMLKEEMIAHEQLERLKFTSESRELTLEETKKVEIFFKVLSAIRSKVKPKEENLSEVPDAELLKLADHFKLSS